MLSPNTLIHNRYLITRQVSGSRAGAVYETFDLQSRASIALKQVIVDEGGNAAAGLSRRAEIEHAAQALAGLRYPSLPVVRNYFDESESMFLVIELVPGEDLATALERNDSPFSVDRVLCWGDQLLDALDYIHTLQPALIHGDIALKNLKLQLDDQIVLLGFGLARSASLADRSLPTFFLSPEQAQGAPADERGDLYALAATLYYLLTNVAPPPAIERAEAIARGQADPLLALDTLNPQIPSSVSNILMQALALDPNQRTADAATMRVTLAQAAQDILPPAPVVVKPPPRQPPIWPRRTIVIASAIFAVLLTSGLALAAYVFVPSFTFRPTPPPATNGPVAIATTIPPTVAINTPTIVVPVITATPPNPTATPPALTATFPAPQVASVEPQSTFVGRLPLALTLRGAALDQVHAARLIADGRAPIDTTLQPAGASQLTLSVAARPEALDGEVQYRLELNGVLLATPTISLRDFVQRKVVRGVLAAYDYTGRVATDVAGAYTRMRGDPNVGSPPAGPLRNDDGIEVLRDDEGGWYQVRVRSSGDPAQVGATGWIERWLVDNQGVPAKPIPLVFAGRVYSAPTDAAVRCGTAFDSSIYGSVENANGRGISGARVRITSADGRNSYTVTTGRGGVYSVPGLGCTTWTVRLISVPSAAGGLQANPVTVRNLNGGRFTAAEVRFKLQKNGS